MANIRGKIRRRRGVRQGGKRPFCEKKDAKDVKGREGRVRLGGKRGKPAYKGKKKGRN